MIWLYIPARTLPVSLDPPPDVRRTRGKFLASGTSFSESRSMFLCLTLKELVVFSPLPCGPSVALQCTCSLLPRRRVLRFTTEVRR